MSTADAPQDSPTNPPKRRIPKKSLSVRQKRLIHGIVVEGKSITQAGLDAGYGRGVNRSSAAAAASVELKKPLVATALEAALRRQGLTVDDSVKAVKDAHGASKTEVSGHPATGLKERQVPDHKVRLAAAEMNFRLNRLLDKEPAEAAPQMNVSAIIIAIREARAARGLNGVTHP